jgi:hypothetical protein
MSDFNTELATRLIRYAAIDSQSDDESPSSPSTATQFSMLTLLKAELEQIGAAGLASGVFPYWNIFGDGLRTRSVCCSRKVTQCARAGWFKPR